MKQLFLYINSIYPLSDDIQKHLVLNLKRRVLSKKDFLLKEGQTCKSINFIEQGLLRCFYIKEAKEVSTWFMKEGDMVISVESFYNQRPGNENIQALEDTIVYSMDYEILQSMYHMFMEFNFIGRSLTEKYYELCEQRIYSLRMQPAIERYLYLLNNHPELIKRVPSKFLASYLGIAMETLSRMKHKLII